MVCDWDWDAVNAAILDSIIESKTEAEVDFWLEMLAEHDKYYKVKWEPIYTDHICE